MIVVIALMSYFVYVTTTTAAAAAAFISSLLIDIFIKKDSVFFILPRPGRLAHTRTSLSS